MPRVMDKKHCSGCYNNFYNGNNQYGIKECWSLKDAKLEARYQLSINTPMGQRSGYTKVRKPQCYHATGWCFLKAIPEYAK